MKLNRILQWVCIVGLFALAFVPLLVSNNLFFPFITGKGFYFRIITEIIFGSWLILAVTNTKFRPKNSWLGWAAVLVVAIMFIADLHSQYPYKSFWSNFERMEGWVTFAHLLGYGIVAGTILTKDMWERLWQTWIGASGAMILFSFLQTFGLLRIDQGNTRIDAALGNSAYLAIYMLFSAFLVLFFLVRRKGNFNIRNHWFVALGLNVGVIAFIAPNLTATAVNSTMLPAAVFWTVAGLIIGDLLLLFSALFERGYWLYALLFLLDFWVVFETETRGAILGFLGGLGLVALLIGIFERDRRWLRRTGWGIVIGMVAILILFFGLKNTSLMKDNGTLKRFADISIHNTTTQSRLILWGMAWQGFLERPILGWGQESFNYVFNKFYDPRLYADEQWFDRAHNIIFDWLVTGGALGFLSYIALFASIIWYIWVGKRDYTLLEDTDTARGWRSLRYLKRLGGIAGDNPFSVAEKSVLTGMLAGYFINNFFVFDNIASYLFYVSIAAYVYTRRTMSVDADTKVLETASASYQPNRVIVPITAVALVLLLYFVNVKPIMANVDLIAAINPSTQPTVEETIAAYQQALSWRTFGDPEIREQLFGALDQLSTQVANSAQQSGTGQPDPGLVTEENKLIAFVEQQANIQISRTPYDARYYLLPGSVLASAGQYQVALPLLQKAQQLSPDKQTILFEIASVYIGEEDFVNALKTLRTAYELDTKDQAAQLLYAAAAIYNKNETLANQILQAPAVSTTTLATNDAILHAYYFIGDYKAVLKMWQERVAIDPTNVNNYVSLAGAYLLVKDSVDAIATLKKVETLDPQAKSQVEQYIQAIQQGKVA